MSESQVETKTQTPNSESGDGKGGSPSSSHPSSNHNLKENERTGDMDQNEVGLGTEHHGFETLNVQNLQQQGYPHPQQGYPHPQQGYPHPQQGYPHPQQKRYQQWYQHPQQPQDNLFSDANASGFTSTSSSSHPMYARSDENVSLSEAFALRKAALEQQAAAEVNFLDQSYAAGFKRGLHTANDYNAHKIHTFDVRMGNGVQLGTVWTDIRQFETTINHMGAHKTIYNKKLKLAMLALSIAAMIAAGLVIFAVFFPQHAPDAIMKLVTESPTWLTMLCGAIGGGVLGMGLFGAIESGRSLNKKPAELILSPASVQSSMFGGKKPEVTGDEESLDPNSVHHRRDSF